MPRRGSVNYHEGAGWTAPSKKRNDDVTLGGFSETLAETKASLEDILSTAGSSLSRSMPWLQQPAAPVHQR